MISICEVSGLLTKSTLLRLRPDTSKKFPFLHRTSTIPAWTAPANSFASPLLIWLGLVAVLGFNFFVRWRLLGMPLERDEGEYAYAGQLFLQGIPPYQLAWNMKFPG